MSKKNSKQAKQHDGPGRPMYPPMFPRTKEFTFTDLEIANGVNPKTGKGKLIYNTNLKENARCTTLTLRKWLKRDKAKVGHSVLVRIKGVTADPNSRKGLGRRAYLYSLRSKASVTRTPKADTAAPSDVSEATKSYEATKAALLSDTSVPVAAPTPEATPAPQPEVTPTPAPETVPAAVIEPAPIANETPAPAPQPEAQAPVLVPVPVETLINS